MLLSARGQASGRGRAAIAIASADFGASIAASRRTMAWAAAISPPIAAADAAACSASISGSRGPPIDPSLIVSGDETVVVSLHRRG